MWKEGLLLVYLLLLSVYDCKERRVPVVWLSVGIGVAGLLAVWAGVTEQMAWHQIIMGILPGILLLLMAWLTKKAGYADGMVMLTIGMLLGHRNTFFLFCLSLFLVSVISILLLMLRKVRGQSRIPYIPFLTAAFLLQGVL